PRPRDRGWRVDRRRGGGTAPRRRTRAVYLSPIEALKVNNNSGLECQKGASACLERQRLFRTLSNHAPPKKPNPRGSASAQRQLRPETPPTATSSRTWSTESQPWRRSAPPRG